MYTGDHVDIRICPVCGDVLTPPSDDGCWICWHGPENGILIADGETGVMVHRHCLDFFGVDTIDQFESQYFDI